MQHFNGTSTMNSLLSMRPKSQIVHAIVESMLGQLLQRLIIFILNQAAYFVLCFERIVGTRVVGVGSGSLTVTAQLRNIARS
jgi:hypothetical protein